MESRVAGRTLRRSLSLAGPIWGQKGMSVRLRRAIPSHFRTSRRFFPLPFPSSRFPVSPRARLLPCRGFFPISSPPPSLPFRRRGGGEEVGGDRLWQCSVRRRRVPSFCVDLPPCTPKSVRLLALPCGERRGRGGQKPPPPPPSPSARSNGALAARTPARGGIFR